MAFWIFNDEFRQDSFCQIWMNYFGKMKRKNINLEFFFAKYLQKWQLAHFHSNDNKQKKNQNGFSLFSFSFLEQFDIFSFCGQEIVLVNTESSFDGLDAVRRNVEQRTVIVAAIRRWNCSGGRLQLTIVFARVFLQLPSDEAQKIRQRFQLFFIFLVFCCRCVLFRLFAISRFLFLLLLRQLLERVQLGL